MTESGERRKHDEDATAIPIANPIANPTIAVVDLGGQYCHLIARRLRDLGLPATILPSNTPTEAFQGYAGIILSGGPDSVYDPRSPRIDPALLRSGRPILGICYGHQLVAQLLGARVDRGAGEYGSSQLELDSGNSIFEGTPSTQTVWMSHSDTVATLPPGTVRLARTDRCEVASFADPKSRLYGVQFHPEVVHTEHGLRILENFVALCGLEATGKQAVDVEPLLERIRRQVGSGSVFFLVSGGVDSTVAFVLCARALGRERVLGLYVDTGLMRLGETDELRENLGSLGLADRLQVRDESKRFLEALAGVRDPEEKRRIIGRLFIEVQSHALRDYGVMEGDWFLGQGTIYPDTIESGGEGRQAALIKTHHNRCPEVRVLLEAGHVVEPLAELYKDEVRELGDHLGIAHRLTHRWPFPGPGLAIRCLCPSESEASTVSPLSLPERHAGYRAFRIPVQTVGVQGDSRTYRQVAAVIGPPDHDRLRALASEVCNGSADVNRVVYLLSEEVDLSQGMVRPRTIDRDRLEILRRADAIVRDTMEASGITDSVWQFPVILVPLGFPSGESVVLRPVHSRDGMTASAAGLPAEVLCELTRKIKALPGVDAVFLDVTDKPPATIEWE